jgi:hypothetical protein
VTRVSGNCSSTSKKSRWHRRRPGSEFRALHRGAEATCCRNLLLLTQDGAAPDERLVPDGPKVRVEAACRWLLDEP